MKKQGSVRYAWLKNKNILLLLVSVFSFFLFFGCLMAIPRSKDGLSTDGRTLLCGAAALLSLALPAFFCLRTAGGDSLAYLGGLPPKASFWRVPLFALGAFALGGFMNVLYGMPFAKSDLLLSRLPSVQSFSAIFLLAILVLAFTTALLPLGLLGERLSSMGSLEVVFPLGLFYASLFFTVYGAPVLLLFGFLLALLRLQSRSFFAVVLCNASLLLGSFLTKIGLFSFFTESRLPPWAVLLVLGALALGCLIGSIDFSYVKKSIRERARMPRRSFLLWILLGGISFLLSLIFATFF